MCMSLVEAIILGIVQGLTEFLPVSSSGHLELGKALLNTGIEDDMAFTVLLHGATVLSTLFVFSREIFDLIKNSLRFEYNDSVKYLLKICVSMIPVLMVGIFFKEVVESYFNGRIGFVGSMLLITSLFLLTTRFIKTEGGRPITWADAFIIGIAQAVAVLPGISRSGITISTGLLLGNKREEVARFSFLMVLVPVIGANLLEIFQSEAVLPKGYTLGIYMAGFFAAFISGIFACKWMINLVKKGNLLYFAIYCFIIGLVAIFLA